MKRDDRVDGCRIGVRWRKRQRDIVDRQTLGVDQVDLSRNGFTEAARISPDYSLSVKRKSLVER